MREFRKILVSAFVVLLPLCVSCEKGSPERRAGAVLQLNVGIEASESMEETKGQIYEGSKFNIGESFGLCIMEAGTTNPFKTDYGNIKVTYTGNTSHPWEYTIGNNSPVDTLVLTSRSDGHKADIYAYAPYIKSVTNPAAISIDMSDNIDFMYDKNNGAHKELDPSSGKNIPLTIAFYHAYSRLCFKIKLENAGSDQQLNYIEVRQKNNGSGSSSLYTEGTCNLTSLTDSHPSFNMTSNKGSIRINCGDVSLTTSDKAYELLLYPTPYVDSSYSVVFGIDGNPYEYVIKKEDLNHNSGKGTGAGPLERLFKYTMSFTYYNYVHLKGITVQRGWTTDPNDIGSSLNL